MTAPARDKERLQVVLWATSGQHSLDELARLAGRARLYPSRRILKSHFPDVYKETWLRFARFCFADVKNRFHVAHQINAGHSGNRRKNSRPKRSTSGQGFGNLSLIELVLTVYSPP